ncbi:hypothetical protein IFM89_027756 [Coptis chinensis]|uniref:WLM domain-containing protein n=1 Tax=Coptis chinensis TaxID=261450 RepID=A0A835LVN6_9MAGN|nr:hypothetical protein IFM89_027756 [Coptis chinensis]
MNMEEHKMLSILVIWRGKRLNVEMNSGAYLKEFGQKLQNLTNVKSDTMRLLIPRTSDNSSKLLSPFSDDHSSLSLKESSILEACAIFIIRAYSVKSIRMMGVFEDEIEEVSQNGTKADLRIAGFDEEERRLRMRMSRPKSSLKLPQGAYIFCDFRTLQLPGVELNPPASEALKRMHMLAADPGIIAIMNKHRWRVGVMTELAPVGYVGVSPKCILGLNKNHGEEISLRLRTDDLKGLRKYESIKKTLLHELAHMVYSEHDADFYTLDKQLNQEAASLDWTRSTSHTLSGLRRSDGYEEEFDEWTTESSSQKLGGKTFDDMATARESSVAAAYRRLVGQSSANLEGHAVDAEPDPDDTACEMHVEPDPIDFVMKDNDLESQRANEEIHNCKSDHDFDVDDQNRLEDHTDSCFGEAMETKPYSGIHTSEISYDPDLDGCETDKCILHSTTYGEFTGPKTRVEPDPDDSETSKAVLKNRLVQPDSDDSLANEKVDDESLWKVSQVPHSGKLEMDGFISGCSNSGEPGRDPDDRMKTDLSEDTNKVNEIEFEPDPDESSLKRDPGQDGNSVEHGHYNSIADGALQHEPDGMMDTSNTPYDITDPNDQELRRIQDPVYAFCTRLQKTIGMLKSEVSPTEATSVLETLFKIIRNVIEHPNETKYRRLRKANPQFRRSVANYKAAMDVLFLVGFNEDLVSDEIGRSETYMVLKRNDPGLLWLAKSSLETCIAC